MPNQLQKPDYADRPPRIQPELPEGKIPIPTPPEDQRRGFSIRQALLPLITIVGYVLISFAGQGRNLLFIAPMALSVIASTLFAFVTYREEVQKAAQKKKEYDLLLADLRREMVASHDRQRSFYEYNYPELATALTIDGMQRDTRSGSRLWERRVGDADFGVVRLGIGARPSKVIYEVDRGSNEEERQMRDAIRLDTDSRIVFDMPITIPLYRPLETDGKPAPPISHAIGIAGSPKDVYPFLQAMLVHLTTFHAPADVNLHVVGVHRAAGAWDWLYKEEDRSSQRSTDPKTQRAVRPRLPHFAMPKSDRDGLHFPVCFETAEGKPELREDDPVAKFFKQLRAELDRREYRLRENKDRGFNNIPLMIVIADMLDEFNPRAPERYLERSTLKEIEAEAAVADLLNKGMTLGATLFVLVPDRQKVPSGCTSVIEVSGGQFRYAEVGVNTTRYLGAADGVAQMSSLTDYVSRLARWSIRQSYGAGIPDAVTLLELNNARSIDDLKIADEWQRSVQATKPKDGSGDEAEWLRAAVGMMANQEIRRLNFKADADGVHGMVAGATGSGKSELLMSMILGLAIRYDPSIVNFVLVDFKGGGAFVPFKNMPHVVDIVTNLQMSDVDRMFKAITAELNRRQEINTITDSKHIVDYRKKGLHLLPPEDFEKRFKREKQPYPHLFVIIDEFAEMMEGDNDYKEQLNRITRLGRALGVSLILAAQRPTGVTDQMRSNIQLRISLRVATPAESSELLRRPDAAFLPNGIPGRGYVQVGQDSLELVQMAWSGAPYREPQQALRSFDDVEYWSRFAGSDVVWLDRMEMEGEPRAFFEVLVDHMAARARAQSEAQRKPWPAPLPTYIALGDPVPEGADYLIKRDRQYLDARRRRLDEQRREVLGEDAPELSHVLPMQVAVSHWLHYTPREGEMPYLWSGVDWRDDALTPIIGLIDDAQNARQRLLFARLRQGNMAVFGAPGWGKSTFLRTLIISLCATHSPAELHVYILDFGSQALTVLEGLPHVGAVITADEQERIERMTRTLDDEIEKRTRLFREQSVNNLYSYNQTHRDKPLPAIVIAIDNFAEIKENMDQLFLAFLALAREGGRAGVHLVATGESTTSFGKIYNLFTERLTLRLADNTEYVSIVGRGLRYVDEIAGRGAIAVERAPLDLQLCVPVAPTDADKAAQRDETVVLRDFVERMAQAWKLSGAPDTLLPEAIETLPTFISFSDRLDYVADEDTLSTAPSVLIGVDDASLMNAWIDLSKSPHVIVAGQQQSGKTNLLRAMILSLALHYSPSEVGLVLIDRLGALHQYSGVRSLASLPHVIAVITEPEQMEVALKHLRYEFEQMPIEADTPLRHLVVVIDNYDDFEELKVKPNDISPLTRFRDKRPPLHFIVAGSDLKLKSQDDFTRRIRAGVATENKTVQSSPFNATIKKVLRDAELPLGRGFIVRAGQASIVQIASLGSASEPEDEVIDRLVFLVIRKYEKQKAEWFPISEDAAPTAPTYTPEQIAWITEELAKEFGIGVDSIQRMMDENDVLDEAQRRGILYRVPDAVTLQSAHSTNGSVPTNEGTEDRS